MRVDLSHGSGRIVWTSDLSRAGKIRHYLYLFFSSVRIIWRKFLMSLKDVASRRLIEYPHVGWEREKRRRNGERSREKIGMSAENTILKYLTDKM